MHFTGIQLFHLLYLKLGRKSRESWLRVAGLWTWKMRLPLS